MKIFTLLGVILPEWHVQSYDRNWLFFGTFRAEFCERHHYRTIELPYDRAIDRASLVSCPSHNNNNCCYSRGFKNQESSKILYHIKKLFAEQARGFDFKKHLCATTFEFRVDTHCRTGFCSKSKTMYKQCYAFIGMMPRLRVYHHFVSLQMFEPTQSLYVRVAGYIEPIFYMQEW